MGIKETLGVKRHKRMKQGLLGDSYMKHQMEFGEKWKKIEYKNNLIICLDKLRLKRCDKWR